MSEVPELSEAEADRIRWGKHSYQETKTYGIVHERLVRSGLLRNDGEITPAALGALDAFDKRKTAQIRIAAMRNCLAIIDDIDRRVEDHSTSWALQEITERIEALIAKEETRT